MNNYLNYLKKIDNLDINEDFNKEIESNIKKI